MEEINIKLERQHQYIMSLQRRVDELSKTQEEIKAMNETLVMLANELKHTNIHLSNQEKKIEALESQPRLRLNHITSSIITALSAGIISFIIASVLSK